MAKQQANPRQGSAPWLARRELGWRTWAVRQRQRGSRSAVHTLQKGTPGNHKNILFKKERKLSKYIQNTVNLSWASRAAVTMRLLPELSSCHLEHAGPQGAPSPVTAAGQQRDPQTAFPCSSLRTPTPDNTASVTSLEAGPIRLYGPGG